MENLFFQKKRLFFQVRSNDFFFFFFISFFFLYDIIVHNKFCWFSKILFVHKNYAHIYSALNIQYNLELLFNSLIYCANLNRTIYNHLDYIYSQFLRRSTIGRTIVALRLRFTRAVKIDRYDI